MDATGQEISPIQRYLLANSISTTFDREALAKKAVELTTPEFIETRILPLIHVRSNGHGCNYRSEIVQNNGTGRLTLRYEFGPENVFFAKLYCDDLGPRCYDINSALWEAGFNTTGPYRVPQPLGFLTDHNLLLMRGVHGTPLGAAFTGHAAVDLVDGSREAAKWLAALHRCPVTTDTPDSDWDSLKLFRMASRLIKAIAARPEKLDVVRGLMEVLEKRITQLRAKRRFVFTHGRYHHDHVFLSTGATAVIDLDRCPALLTRPRTPLNLSACSA
jgi:hypothetical protein